MPNNWAYSFIFQSYESKKINLYLKAKISTRAKTVELWVPSHPNFLESNLATCDKSDVYIYLGLYIQRRWEKHCKKVHRSKQPVKGLFWVLRLKIVRTLFTIEGRRMFIDGSENVLLSWLIMMSEAPPCTVQIASLLLSHGFKTKTKSTNIRIRSPIFRK